MFAKNYPQFASLFGFVQICQKFADCCKLKHTARQICLWSVSSTQGSSQNLLKSSLVFTEYVKVCTENQSETDQGLGNLAVCFEYVKKILCELIKNWECSSFGLSMFCRMVATSHMNAYMIGL